MITWNHWQRRACDLRSWWMLGSETRGVKKVDSMAEVMQAGVDTDEIAVLRNVFLRPKDL